MSHPTKLLPIQLVKDLHVTLARLRLAREVGDTQAAQSAETRLNQLIERLPRTTTTTP